MANRQTVRDHQNTVGALPCRLANEAFQESGRPIVAIGRTFTAFKPVVGPAMRPPLVLLGSIVHIATIDLPKT